MIRLTLAQMRRNRGRLAAAALAIVVGTAFVAATLLGGALIRDTTYRAVTASLADADVVAYPVDGPFDDDAVRRVEAQEVVHAADGIAEVYGQVSAGGQRDAAVLRAVPSAAALSPFTILEGSAPSGDDEIALTEAGAERLDVAVGDAVQVQWERFVPVAGEGTAEETSEWVTETADVTLTGIIADPPAMLAAVSAALVSRANLEQWLGESAYDSILVAGDGAPEALAEQVRAALPQAVVRTAEQEAEQQTQDLTGSSQTLTYVVLAFAAVAMFVAALVITNTFQVLVAQRTRTLALLRCVGATKAQVHRSVLLEALVLGILAGTGGLLVGLGLGQGAVWLLGRADLGLELPATITVTPAVVIAPIVTGTLVTLVAALAPARVATRVAPLAALRPAPGPSSAGRGSRARLGLAITLATIGALLLSGAALATVLLAENEADILGLALSVGILGGILSFAGVMVGAVFLVPRAVHALGSLAARAARSQRRTAQLATVNATRNPRRTSATASALLIGVALVMMMSTGAASMRASLGAVLDQEFPVDLVASSMAGDADAELTAAQLDAVAAVEGVAETMSLPAARAWLLTDEPTATELTGLDLEVAERVLHDPSLVAGLDEDVALVSASIATALGIEDGEDIGIAPAAPDGSGTAGPAQASVTVRVSAVGTAGILVSPQVLAAIDPQAPVLTVWARLAGDDPAGTVLDVQDALAEATPEGQAVPFVTGAAAERQQFEQIIDTLLMIVIGLLAVAVVIALIGVANTLSLSVIERSREHALLRAVGLTRGQLRGMLATEGALIALTGTVLGAVLGIAYGWAGTTVILGAMGDPQLAVPWGHLGVVVVVAVVAGLLASVLPARSAARTPPVAALAA